MDFLHSVFGNDLGAAALIIFNLIIIESLLSVDNAAVLATMVMDLPENQRKKALKYGILGAYLFRGICILFAAYLVQFLFLKFLGGLYLLWLTFTYFRTKATPQTDDDILEKHTKWYYKYTVGAFGAFWATVVAVEVMDLAFSIDNVFAVVAFTNNIYLIWIGVFIGILAMRFVAQGFVKLMERFTFLETVAFLVIGVLGIKLILSFAADFYKETAFHEIINGHSSDMIFSILTVTMFFLPILTSYLFNFPKRISD